MCKEVTLNSLFSLLKKVPVADRQRVVKIAYDAIRPEIESISDQYKEFYSYYNELENFSLASGETFTIVENEKDLLKSEACNEGVSTTEFAEKNGIELPEEAEAASEAVEPESSDEKVADPTFEKLMESDPEFKEKYLAAKAAEHEQTL